MVSKIRKPRDVNQLANLVVDLATGHRQPEVKPDKNLAAVALSKLGASKGGKARAKSLTSRQRIEIASAGAAARWWRMD